MEIQDIKNAISEIEDHDLPAVVTEARQIARNQYNNDIEFIIADGAVRNRRLTQSEEQIEKMAVEIHEVGKDVLNLKEDMRLSEKARATGAPFWRRAISLIALVALLALAIGIVVAVKVF